MGDPFPLQVSPPWAPLNPQTLRRALLPSLALPDNPGGDTPARIQPTLAAALAAVAPGTASEWVPASVRQSLQRVAPSHQQPAETEGQLPGPAQQSEAESPKHR